MQTKAPAGVAHARGPRLMTVAPLDSYPRSSSDFSNWFRSEDDCLTYLARLRWPTVFTCPSCGWAGEAWHTGRGLYVCGSCSRQTSITSGTIFAGTKTPLRAWLQCAWVLATSADGSSAVKLQELTGVPNYRTLWAMLQRYRRAMFQPSRCRLTGRLDLSFLLIEAIEGSPLSSETKSSDNLVLYLSEVGNDSSIGRVRMAAVADGDLGNVPRLVSAFAQPSALITVGSAAGYADTPATWMHAITSGRTHRPSIPARSLAYEIDSWLRTTHGGAIHSAHLNYYLGELLYRHNRRTTPETTSIFCSLLRHALRTKPIPYKDLVAAPSNPLVLRAT